MPLDRPLEITNREGLITELGICSNCNRNSALDPRVQEFTLGVRADLFYIFRLCTSCRKLLSELLQKPLQPLPKPDRDSPEWSRRAYSLALDHSPTIYPCKRCGWPVIKGEACSCGGQADLNLEPFSE